MRKVAPGRSSEVLMAKERGWPHLAFSLSQSAPFRRSWHLRRQPSLGFWRLGSMSLTQKLLTLGMLATMRGAQKGTACSRAAKNLRERRTTV